MIHNKAKSLGNYIRWACLEIMQSALRSYERTHNKEVLEKIKWFGQMSSDIRKENQQRS